MAAVPTHYPAILRLHSQPAGGCCVAVCCHSVYLVVTVSVQVIVSVHILVFDHFALPYYTTPSPLPTLPALCVSPLLPGKVLPWAGLVPTIAMASLLTQPGCRIHTVQGTDRTSRQAVSFPEATVYRY